MIKDYNFKIYGHPSHQDPQERKLHIYFVEPSAGINANTGILLLIAGFGGNANSNVYKKMRNTFANEYNLVVVQCDYFGWEFMQSTNNISIDFNRFQIEEYFSKEEIKYIQKDQNIFTRLMEMASKRSVHIPAKENLKETLANYNDMGLIQAIDNISAVISVMEIIKDNGYQFNEDRVMLYGNSQGAYLSYLCNALAPNLFSFLIDNSSWLIPQYLQHKRYLNVPCGKTVLTVEFDYLARSLDIDDEILYLPSLYKKFHNQCQIICYHGTNDSLISHTEKVGLKKIIKGFQYNEISEKDIDKTMFKSTKHGLGADYLKLYEYTMKRYNPEVSLGVMRKNENVTYETKKNKYLIDYSQTIPILHINKK